MSQISETISLTSPTTKTDSVKDMGFNLSIFSCTKVIWWFEKQWVPICSTLAVNNAANDLSVSLRIKCGCVDFVEFQH